VSINVLSVFGFILVLGLLVDDAIVTAESAYARLERDGNRVWKAWLAACSASPPPPCSVP
jgi:multidrug efflux pump subunit AcrB